MTALIPCLATALIIYINNYDYQLIGKVFFENSVTRFIGKISYSLYLVHWPIIVFGHYKNSFLPLNNIEKILMFFASMICATILYYLVESPLRYKHNQAVSKYVAPILYVACVVLLASGVIYGTKGADFRSSDNIAAIVSNTDNVVKQTNEVRKNLGTENDIFSNSPDATSVFFLGDSHSQDLLNSFAQAPFLKKISASHLWLHGDEKRYFLFLDPNDKRYDTTKQTVTTMKEYKNADFIFLSARWPLDISEQQLKNFQTNLQDIRSLTKAEIIVWGSQMVYTKNAFDVLERENNFATFEDEYNKYQRTILYSNDIRLRKATENIGLTYISKLEYLCPDKQYCTEIIPNTQKLMHFDVSHLTVEGAQFLGKLFEKDILDIITKKKSK